MVPKTGARRKDAQPSKLFEFGQKGRKTGVDLPDTGTRDEHGMQPLEGIFSSPEKTGPVSNGIGDESTGEEDMDLESEAGPGPASMLRPGPRLIPRGTSPRKTNIQSPAIRNPHIGPSSSPIRGSIVETHSQPNRATSVSRKLEFGAAQFNGMRANGAKPNGANGISHDEDEEDEDDEEAILHGQDDSLPMNGGDESMQMLDVDNDDDAGAEASRLDEDVVEDEPIIEPSKAKAGKRKAGRPRKGPAARSAPPEEEADIDEEPPEEEPEVEPVRRRGRPAKSGVQQDHSTEQESSAKRRRSLRNSFGDANEQDEEEESRSSKRQRTDTIAPKPKGKPGRPKGVARDREAEASSANAAAKPGAAKGKRGRKRKSDVADDSIIGIVQKGPPMPKSRGLVSLKREDPNAISQTRSGRHSYKPLAYWKNEHVAWDGDEAQVDMFNPKKSKFLLPSIKEVVRVEDDEDSRPRKPKSKKGKVKRRDEVDEKEEEALEPWEVDPGTVLGEVLVWEVEHEFNPPALDDQVEIVEEQLAVSSEAVLARDVRDATFRFAKTLSLPFFGSGVVDLPPGAEKRPKNSRKMQMTFFVFCGKVLVTVNETQFRIGPGGMWFVPRGNYYSIMNDYDSTARIFFSQGCEVNTVERLRAEASQDSGVLMNE